MQPTRPTLPPAPVPPPARGRAAARRRWLAWLLAWLLGPAAWAAAEAPALGSPAWRDGMAAWLQAQADAQMRETALPVRLRVEVEVGSLDARLRLAPCQRVEPYLPPGTRLWGRTRIGLRCAQGAVPWNVFLPIQVRVWGPGWVLRQPVAAGTPLEPAHAAASEVEWTAERQPVLARAEDWVGLQAVRALPAGQVLRAGSVRAPQVFATGSTVKVRVQGQGFTLTATGEALGPGHLGETVRVRLPGKRVVLGTVVDATTVELAL
ncbi:Flagella basal body P-ring formation protein FlgA [Tepidimonas sediminis]|uniref:Flagella basal body P-ring formation protein FlgA n=1 Tax=Tepidimonas sediminis TaxID=2588941 RepID=A0A554WTJ0_9BURK|nr:flagellar basal body P-ring formation chaperone FlgA [Tepidimonas sediminis]TSE26883.1 Flagella basal body P-ring formation protein FlgA [Tepidimonas sediminis]